MPKRKPFKKKEKKKTLEVTFYITCQEKLKLDKVAASSLLKKEKEKKDTLAMYVFFHKVLKYIKGGNSLYLWVLEKKLI